MVLQYCGLGRYQVLVFNIIPLWSPERLSPFIAAAGRNFLHGS